MKYSNIFNVNWNFQTIAFLAFLVIVPNFLGMMNISTAFGFKIHLFQYGIFLAALIYGPVGGVMSGLMGSIYPAMIMGNPYILIGNAILGLCVGLFRHKFNTFVAVLLAYCIQLPWLVLSDYYLMNLPLSVIQGVVIALAISNMIWAVVAHISIAPIKKALEAELSPGL